MIDIYLYLMVSAVLFALGTYGLMTRRNIIRMLLSAEVIFNAALLAFLALSSVSSSLAAPGGALVIIAISLSAAEVGVIVSIAILMFRKKESLDVYELSEFKG